MIGTVQLVSQKGRCEKKRVLFPAMWVSLRDMRRDSSLSGSIITLPLCRIIS